MPRSTLRILCAAAALTLLAGAPAQSAETGESNAAERAGRGMAAMTIPFLEIPGNIVRTQRREGPAQAWTEGLARGLGMTLLRPPVGLYELVTAPFPALADDPPVLEPEYPWTYLREETDDPPPYAQR